MLMTTAMVNQSQQPSGAGKTSHLRHHHHSGIRDNVEERCSPLNDIDKTPPTQTTRLRDDFHSVDHSSTGVDHHKTSSSEPSGSDASHVQLAAAGRRLGNLNQQRRSRCRRRLVQKTGDCNVLARNVTKRNQKFLVDLFTTMVDMRWRWHAAAFPAAFIVTWLFFTVVWYVFAFVHDDIGQSNPEHHPCIDNVFDFTSALLFSIETQSTIGYGYRVIQAECPWLVGVLMTQSCLGLFIQVLATGIIFAKVTRPKSRAQTILFSERAVICLRDGCYWLLLRVGDMRRRSHIIGTSIRAVLVQDRLTAEGESIPLCQSPLTLETEASSSDSFVFLVWPAILSHRIDASSPLWQLSAEQLHTGSVRFEIIVILEGTVESTGHLMQVRTSYLESEVAWGERLCPLLTYQSENGQYEIDYSQFHHTQPISMPLCSADDWTAERCRQDALMTSDPTEPDYSYTFTMPGQRPQSAPSSLRRPFSRRHERARRIELHVVSIPSSVADDDDRRQRQSLSDVRDRFCVSPVADDERRGSFSG